MKSLKIKNIIMLIFVVTLIITIIIDKDYIKTIESYNNNLSNLNKEKNQIISKLEEENLKNKNELDIVNQKDDFIDKVIVATFILETGHGESELFKHGNNFGGIKCLKNSDNYCNFENKAIGFVVFKNLIQDFVKAYGYDLKKIRQVYTGFEDEEFIKDYNEFLEIFKGL